MKIKFKLILIKKQKASSGMGERFVVNLKNELVVSAMIHAKHT